ncbi:MAG TPA: prepilin-type N-terminal cleavage/methylation domain-containing protein [Gammaproteobacteria bacterium]|nr:prepilin-type N-terminal cleavage/methylation domain-containing protein [Gammaproteobacteria bacterium]
MNAKCVRSKLTAAFSLIELMVVIAIVALLTAIAVPSYQGYLQQSKVTEIFSLASDQMSQWQQAYNQGSAFDTVNPVGFNGGVLTTANIGTYIAGAEILDATSTPTNTNCPDPGGLGEVCLQLVSPSGIDTTLDGLVIYFTPATQGSSTGDTSNTSIGWTCNFPTTGNSTNDATITSLLSPGSCTAA